MNSIGSTDGSYNNLIDQLLTFCDLSTIAVSVICKLPQILSILKSRSVEGLSESSVFVELLGYSIVLCYNVFKGYATATYMEYFFLVAQDILLLAIIFHFKKSLDVLKVGAFGLLSALFYGFSQGIPNPLIPTTLIQLSTPCSASSKVMQLKKLYDDKNSDSVSILTWVISAYTCITRIFSTVMTTGDIPMLFNFSIALILNASVIGLSYFYRIKTKTVTHVVKNGNGTAIKAPTKPKKVRRD